MAESPQLTQLSDENLNKTREVINRRVPPLADPAPLGVKRKKIFIPQVGGPDVRCLLYTPNQHSDNMRGAYLHIHGGGYLFGSPDGSDASNLLLAKIDRCAWRDGCRR